MLSTNFAAKAVADVKTKLNEEGLKLPTKVSTPLSSGYRTERDSLRELSGEEQNYYCPRFDRDFKMDL